MKFFTFLCFVLLMALPVQAQGVFDWNHSWQSLKDWPEDHWESQNYEPLVERQEHRLPSRIRTSQSDLPVSAGEIAPVMARLRDARIVMDSYDLKEESFWFWIDDKVSDNSYVIEIAQNFYTLSAHDKNAVMHMMAQVHPYDALLIKDINTNNFVGQYAGQTLRFF